MAPAVTAAAGNLSLNWLIEVLMHDWFRCLARHKHLSTTQRYIDVNESKLRGAIELI